MDSKKFFKLFKKVEKPYNKEFEKTLGLIKREKSGEDLESLTDDLNEHDGVLTYAQCAAELLGAKKVTELSVLIDEDIEDEVIENEDLIDFVANNFKNAKNVESIEYIDLGNPKPQKGLLFKKPAIYFYNTGLSLIFVLTKDLK